MSNNDIENETQSNMDDMLQAIQYKNLSQSRHHFDNLMQDKISDALEAEKVNIASHIYNPQLDAEGDVEAELDVDYDEYVDDGEEDTDVESELEDTFDESEYEEDEVEV